MTRLVDGLFDVSRLNRGRLHLLLERTDLRCVVSNAIETAQPLIQERHHRLASVLPDKPVWLQGDPYRLEQVFVNLLANASRYTDSGGELSVWVHTRHGQAIVRIRDSGLGIAPEALRKLIESHRGSVTAASGGLGRGSEFTVRLPTEE